MARTRTRTASPAKKPSLSDQMRARAGTKNKETSKDPDRFLSSGSTMLNLAMTGRIDAGWPLSRISTLPGQSAAGKTILVLGTFAEACIDSKFDEYDLYYDDVERRNDFDLDKLFKPLASRLMTPSGLLYRDLPGSDAETGISNTIQDLKNTMMTLKKKGGPFIYIADSLDSFSTDEELDKEMKKALQAAKTDAAVKKISGSYNVEKAKILGQILRMINGVIADTNSLFILTQQIRQRMNPMFGQSPYVTSGGEAPYFYSHIRPWLTKVESYKALGRKIGVRSKAVMEKNSVTGQLRDVDFDIYYDMGIDDVGSMVRFMLTENHWKSGSWIEAPELELRENGKDKLARAIEEKNLEVKLRRAVQRVWNKIEQEIKLNRKPRYK